MPMYQQFFVLAPLSPGKQSRGSCSPHPSRPRMGPARPLDQTQPDQPNQPPTDRVHRQHKTIMESRVVEDIISLFIEEAHWEQAALNMENSIILHTIGNLSVIAALPMGSNLLS